MSQKIQLFLDEHRICMSLCQDIVYAMGKGKLQTPKSLTLGMALRHLSGNKAISQIVSKLGHCSSYDTILRLETAMATDAQISGAIPTGFVKQVWATVVWDNIDFCEETISGSGTTHFVNGILVQAIDGIPPVSDQTRRGTSISRRLKRFLSDEMTQNAIVWNKNMRTGPIVQVAIEIPALEHSTNIIDNCYCFIKNSHLHPEKFPDWMQYNRNISLPTLPKSLIHYLPVIESPATDMSTIDTILARSIAMADQLELKKIAVVCDLAIYSKVQELRWKNEAYMSRTIIRLGEFHVLMSFLGILGKRFGDAGWSDILIEANVVAGGSMNGVLTGHEYNRSVRSHKVFFEALERLRIQQFLSTLDEPDQACYQQVFSSLASTFTTDSFMTDIHDKKIQDLLIAYQQHIKQQSERNPSYAFWSSYSEMVSLMLDFVRATRTGDWKLHMDTLKKMIPWYFSYDQKNYRRLA